MAETMECGCRIVRKLALQEIEYCPMHQAAKQMLEALRQLIEDCQWTRAGMGYEVESRSGKDIGVGHMLLDARDAIAKATGG